MRVRVYNDNSYPYKEMYKGELIDIPAGKYVEMEFEDAVDFKGTYVPIKVDGGGTPLKQSYKKIRIVKPADFKNESPEFFLCQSCGEKFTSQSELDSHIDSKHLNQMADEDEKEKRLKARK